MQLNVSVHIPFSPGELIDKATILEIKIEHLQNPQPLYGILKEEPLKEKLHYCTFEYAKLATLIASFEGNEEIKKTRDELKDVNRKIWDTETMIRKKEVSEEFDEEFISLARSIYTDNDERHKLKEKINEISGSDFREQKVYELETGWPAKN